MHVRTGLVLIFSFIILSSAHAMRCGTKLVDVGDSKFNIISKCGEPLDKQTYTEEIPLYNQAGYQIGTTVNVVERWIYQKSPADFQYTLVFSEGVVTDISANRNP